MRIAVLGAGVVGLTSAWELAQRGHDVTVIEAREGPGEGTSFGNGAQLAYNFVAPFASPETLRKLPELLFEASAPTRIRPGFDPGFIRWGLAFLRECTAERAAATTRAQLALAALSRLVLHEWTQAQSLDYGLRQAGKLVIQRKQKAWGQALAQLERQARDGGAEQRALSGAECLELAPALTLRAEEIAGGVFTPSEEVGDCALFCRELAARLKMRNDVAMLFGAQARGLVLRDGAVRAVETSTGEVETDLAVLAMGPQARAFAKTQGFHLPIYPMKGYSITPRPKPGAPQLGVSVTDADRKIVYAPLADADGPLVRVAGIADFAGDDPAIDSKRLAHMTGLAADTMALDLDGDVRPWAGLRPATPDSRPIIGASPVKGLFLNVGHGALGWTLGAGAARLLGAIIDAEPPPLDPALFALSRSVQ